MVVDSSALIAIVRREPEMAQFSYALEKATLPKMSAATYVEACVVVDGLKNPLVSRRIDELIRLFSIQTLPFTLEQAQLARQAYRDFGRGSGHPARLNFGDCFSYALAKDLGEPLLFKGSDFASTDIEAAG